MGHSSRLSILSEATLRELYLAGALIVKSSDSLKELIALQKFLPSSEFVSVKKFPDLSKVRSFLGELKLINHQIQLAGSERQFWCSNGCW
jgi:hypothetical protein